MIFCQQVVGINFPFGAIGRSTLPTPPAVREIEARVAVNDAGNRVIQLRLLKVNYFRTPNCLTKDRFSARFDDAYLLAKGRNGFLIPLPHLDVMNISLSILMRLLDGRDSFPGAGNKLRH